MKDYLNKVSKMLQVASIFQIIIGTLVMFVTKGSPLWKDNPELAFNVLVFVWVVSIAEFILAKLLEYISRQ